MPSWQVAQLKQRGNFTFTLYVCEILTLKQRDIRRLNRAEIKSVSRAAGYNLSITEDMKIF
jgi:hypothetical protein